MSVMMRLMGLLCSLFVTAVFLTSSPVLADEIKWFPQQARFAPDGSHLLVNVCEVGNSNYCRIWRFWMADSHWDALPLAKDQTYLWPDYAPDGKAIVLSTMPCPDKKCDLRDARLALMDTDGRNLRRVPGTEVSKLRPAFSHDAKRAIYWQIGEVLKTRRQMAAFMDVWETELATGKERRLTNFAATVILSGPKYWPDDRRFMFSAMDFFRLPEGYRKPGDSPILLPNMMRYAEKHKGHMVFVLEPESSDLKPFFVTDKNWSVGFDVSRDGKKLLYASSGGTSSYGSIYVHDLTVLSEPVMILRERGAGSAIMDAAFSRDGQQAAIVRDITYWPGAAIYKAKNIELWLVDMEGRKPKHIAITQLPELVD
ncbi:TolB family protein [Sulfuritortus calidifontis]|uniref:TolB family protein n=1 Tax=Sulfuritortus calidifontis TaxID=1914471 RepID=UPI000F841BE3|nr:hypothetical protein [Sulfuritortus calidifontis]